MRSNTPSTIEQTVASLARDVDYWKDRALKAERELRFNQEEQIRQHPDLWKSYKGMLTLFGDKPLEDTRPAV